MADTMLYKAGPVQPVCLAGDTVGLWVQKLWKYVKVTLVEGIPYGSTLVQNLGAVAAGAQVQPVQLTILDMNDYSFGQFRMRVLDDIAVELWLGRADKRYSTKTTNSRVTLFTDLLDPHGNQTEFFIHEDDHAFVGCINETGYALLQARVAFWGFRYAYEEILNPSTGKDLYSVKSPPPVYTRIPTQSF